MNVKDLIIKETAEAIKNKIFPGCALGVVDREGNREIFSFGNFTYEATSPMIKNDTIFDVASITKSIPTGSLALQLIDDGAMKLTDKLIDHLPEFRNSDRENVLIKHLFTYTLDGYGLAALKEKNASRLYETLLTRDFEKRPGTVFKYTNIPAALLGLVIERITGDTLDTLADTHFFKPLAMHRTTFYPEHFFKRRNSTN